MSVQLVAALLRSTDSIHFFTNKSRVLNNNQWNMSLVTTEKFHVIKTQCLKINCSQYRSISGHRSLFERFNCYLERYVRHASKLFLDLWDRSSPIA